MFGVEHARHLVFLDDEHGCGCDRGGRRHVVGLARKAPFPKKITCSQNRYNGFFAGLVDYRQLHAAFLNVHDILRGIALCEDGLLLSKVIDLSP